MPTQRIGVIASSYFGTMVSRGPECLTNGTFTGNLNSWNYNAQWSYSSGTAAFDDTATGGIWQDSASLAETILASTNYELKFDLAISSGNANIYFGASDGGTAYITYTNYTNGSKTLQFTTPGTITPGGLSIYASSANSDNAFTIDNVSLKRVL